VQDTIYDKFISLLVSRVKEHVVGNGFDENSSSGPMASKRVFVAAPSMDPRFFTFPCFDRFRKLNTTRSGAILRPGSRRAQ
jgi:hypothetical protein